MNIKDRLLLTFASIRKRQLFHADPVVIQEKFLLKLVKKSAHTVFGKTHDFSSIRTVQDFLERVAPQSYDDFLVDISAITDGALDVLFPGRPECLGVTSGTNGTPKQIPLNRALLWSTRNAAFDAALLGGLKHGSMFWQQGKMLYIGPRKGRPMGNLTAYAEGTAFVYLQPFRFRFVPSYKELPEPEEAHNFSFLADLARLHRISAVAGNPVEIVEFVNDTGIVMPEVNIIFNCGYWATDFMHVYQSAFPNATVVDVYSSNEGTYGLPVLPGEFLLNYRRVFFSFLPLQKPFDVPFDYPFDGVYPERSRRAQDRTPDMSVDGKDEIVGIDAAIPGKKYTLCVTTPGGLWNYLTGDVVSFVSLKPPIIKFHGREQRALPLDSDWLTEDEVVGAVRKSGIRSLEYFLTPESHPEPLCFQERFRRQDQSFERNRTRYILYVDGEIVDAETVEQHLCEMNPTYARLKASGDLDPLLVRRASIIDQTRRKPVRINVTPLE